MPAETALAGLIAVSVAAAPVITFGARGDLPAVCCSWRRSNQHAELQGRVGGSVRHGDWDFFPVSLGENPCRQSRERRRSTGWLISTRTGKFHASGVSMSVLGDADVFPVAWQFSVPIEWPWP